MLVKEFWKEGEFAYYHIERERFTSYLRVSLSEIDNANLMKQQKKRKKGDSFFPWVFIC